jgi:hypothetical protein
LKHCVVRPCLVIGIDSGELLVGRHQR